MVFAYNLCFIAVIQIHETLAGYSLQCLVFVCESRDVDMSC